MGCQGSQIIKFFVFSIRLRLCMHFNPEVKYYLVNRILCWDNLHSLPTLLIFPCSYCISCQFRSAEHEFPQVENIPWKPNLWQPGISRLAGKAELRGYDHNLILHTSLQVKKTQQQTNKKVMEMPSEVKYFLETYSEEHSSTFPSENTC